MKIFSPYVSFQEVPGEISFSIPFYGCPLSCDMCHYKNYHYDYDITMTNLLNKIKDEPFITCVCLLGGTWNNNLQYLINEIKNLNLKVCLYTGYKDTTLYNIDYLKIGPFIEECGGLSSNKTNQRMFNLSTGEDITYKFWK